MYAKRPLSNRAPFALVLCMLIACSSSTETDAGADDASTDVATQDASIRDGLVLDGESVDGGIDSGGSDAMTDATTDAPSTDAARADGGVRSDGCPVEIPTLGMLCEPDPDTDFDLPIEGCRYDDSPCAPVYTCGGNVFSGQGWVRIDAGGPDCGSAATCPSATPEDGASCRGFEDPGGDIWGALCDFAPSSCSRALDRCNCMNFDGFEPF